ncbi:hypothetical protein DFP72DRAFT_889532, partial [Ephemerocybe angulata]
MEDDMIVEATETQAEGVPSAAPGAPSQVFNNMELTSLIVQSLKGVTLLESGVASVVPPGGLKTSRPASWKQYFARLAMVNRTFFHASIEVLWEHMSSLEPFFNTLLPADRKQNDMFSILLSYYRGVRSVQWHRFTLYSSRTKSLALNRFASSQLDESSWVMFFATDKTKPDPLFPALKTVYMSSNSNLSLLVAFSFAPYITSITVDLDAGSNEPVEESGIALTTLLQERARNLTHAALLSPFNSDTASRIFEITSLSSLSLHANGETSAVDFTRVKNLPLLEKLQFTQTLDASRPSPLPPLLDFPRVISAPLDGSPRLRELSVRANPPTHYQLAASITSQSLESIHLVSLSDDPEEHAMIIPHILTIHAKRNLNLKSLVVEYRTLGLDWDQDTINPMRGDPLYDKALSFTQALSALRNLTTLKISRVPFLTVDIMALILDAVHSLPMLELLWLDVTSMTDLDEDEVVIPFLHSLDDISRTNQRLNHCVLAIDLAEVPPIPNDYISTNRLKKLDLCTMTVEDLEERSTEYRLRIAQYLDRLFPHLETLTDTLPRGGGKHGARFSQWFLLSRHFVRKQPVISPERQGLVCLSKGT